MRAVIHLSDMDRASRALGHASNLLGPAGGREDAAVVDNIRAVAIVANANGVPALSRDGDHAERLRDLIDAGLSVRACENSLRKNELTVDQLVDGVETVPSGVVHLVRLQDLDWAYIKP